jgi:xanthine dehydrogenase accessory factor
MEVVESLLGPLLPLFERERHAGRPVALGVLVATAGSTYRKPGALMLIASNGDTAGLLSGGCLEGDLAEYARRVIETGEPHVVSYDMRGGDDLIWGLGLGCEGAMQILLIRVAADQDWQPITYLWRCMASNRSSSVGIVFESECPEAPVGTLILEGSAAFPEVAATLKQATHTGRTGYFESATPRWKVFAMPLSLPPHLLLLGAGPDAAPVVDFAARLNWKITVIDHRPTYADPDHFPQAEQVIHAAPDEIPLDFTHYSAAVIMSHHLPSDLKYLRTLASTNIPYIGLLGPAVRRERLLTDLGEDAMKVRGRLHAPVGLPIGGRTPESIALAIVAEIHAFVHNAPAAGRTS